jgi:drug/metabolite transporter (DMT)-like permease
MQTSSWLKWAILEGLTKTGSRTLQKVIGVVSQSWGGIFLASGIVGLVQVIVASFEMKRRNIRFFGDTVGAIGSAIFGILALVITVLGFAIFLKGGDVGTTSFIFTISIVPGMLLDMIFFRYKSTIREWIGMSIAIFAGWAILGFPRSFMHMPLWVWLAISLMLLAAVNQAVTRAIKEVDSMFKNFWGGLMAVIITPVILVWIGQGNLMIESGNSKLWITSMMIGVIVIAMWSFNLLSYQHKASIALKKLVMGASHLISSVVVGCLFFGESLTFWKAMSLPTYCLAFILMDKKAWEFVTSKLKSPDQGL